MSEEAEEEEHRYSQDVPFYIGSFWRLSRVGKERECVLHGKIANGPFPITPIRGEKSGSVRTLSLHARCSCEGRREHTQQQCPRPRVVPFAVVRPSLAAVDRNNV